VEAFRHIREGASFLLLDKGIPAPDWQPAETPLLTVFKSIVYGVVKPRRLLTKQATD
jgi:hypothetical protein